MLAVSKAHWPIILTHSRMCTLFSLVLAVGAVGGVLALKAGLVAVGFGAGGVIFGTFLTPYNIIL